MKLNWLYDVEPVEVSYVDKPAIDRQFIALKRVEVNKEPPEVKKVEDETFLDRLRNKVMKKLGVVDTKIGRVLSKTNEDRLLEAANTINQAVKIIKSVLQTVNKNVKEGKMEEKEIKELIQNTVKEELDTFKVEVEGKLEKLLFGDEEKVKEPKVAPVVETEEEKEKKKKEEEEEKKKVSDEKSFKGSLLTKVSELFGEKFKEIQTKMETIEKELNIKPETDKKEVNKKEVEEKAEKGEVDFTGAFGFGKQI